MRGLRPAGGQGHAGLPVCWSTFRTKPLVAASGMAGLDSANTIRTRRAFGRLYLCGDGASDVSDRLGLVSRPSGGVRRHQAHMILRLLAGETEP